MFTRHQIRRLAMQMLYQIDLRGQEDIAAIRRGLDTQSYTKDVCEKAFELAQAAWRCRQQADSAISQVASAWPTHRQPPVDRAILRLAYCEMVTGHAPPRVAINEAVILAKQYCAEQSPGFVNGVLDKVARQLNSSPVPMPAGDL